MDMTHLCQEIDRLLAQKGRILLAIDGRCGAGKTTLATQLAGRYDCNLFHMDDFFLRPEQRTAQRYEEPGGNVDYERFYEEVLTPLRRTDSFSYRKYDCSTQALTPPVLVTPKALNIIEGSYSTHPYFSAPYDFTVFLTTNPETQKRRILQRPAHLHEPFFQRWIPMEEAYFRTYSIMEHCDLVIETTL